MNLKISYVEIQAMNNFVHFARITIFFPVKIG